MNRYIVREADLVHRATSLADARRIQQGLHESYAVVDADPPEIAICEIRRDGAMKVIR